MYRSFKRVSGDRSGNYIYFWKSKGFSDEYTAPNTSNYKLNLELSFFLVLKQE